MAGHFHIKTVGSDTAFQTRVKEDDTHVSSGLGRNVDYPEEPVSVFIEEGYGLLF